MRGDKPLGRRRLFCCWQACKTFIGRHEKLTACCILIRTLELNTRVGATCWLLAFRRTPTSTPISSNPKKLPFLSTAGSQTAAIDADAQERQKNNVHNPSLDAAARLFFERRRCTPARPDVLQSMVKRLRLFTVKVCLPHLHKCS